MEEVESNSMSTLILIQGNSGPVQFGHWEVLEFGRRTWLLTFHQFSFNN